MMRSFNTLVGALTFVLTTAPAWAQLSTAQLSGRVVDESGEDYGYAADRFFAIDVPKPLERALLKVAS